MDNSNRFNEITAIHLRHEGFDVEDLVGDKEISCKASSGDDDFIVGTVEYHDNYIPVKPEKVENVNKIMDEKYKGLKKILVTNGRFTKESLEILKEKSFVYKDMWNGISNLNLF